MSTAELSKMIDQLTEEDLYATFKYVEFLVNSRKKSAQSTLRDIQALFDADKGWISEEEMIADMAVYSLYKTLPFIFCKSAEKLQGFIRDENDIPVLSDALYNNADVIL